MTPARLEPVDQLPPALAASLRGVLCDIDDTLTWRGRLVPAAFDALARLQAAGLRVVPVTGRPAGWVDQIARLWPVDGVVGENGGLWSWRADGRLHVRYAQDAATRAANRARLDAVADDILRAVPGAALASDQAYRALDLAIDFCEDVPPLGAEAIDAIVAAFGKVGARCKVSSIHVNGWFGDFDKRGGVHALLRERWGTDDDDARATWLYVGDSPNDAPMFAAFPHTVGVANVREHLDRMDAWPRWITTRPGGEGFAELVDRILAARG